MAAPGPSDPAVRRPLPTPLTTEPAARTPLAAAPADPASLIPEPADPTPLTTAPADPTLLAAAPADPTPLAAASADPTSLAAAPADPAPLAAAPADPAPLASKPADPAQLAAKPTDPTPLIPEPADPTPHAANPPQPAGTARDSALPAETERGSTLPGGTARGSALPGGRERGSTLPASPRSGDTERGPTLLVFADSLAFHGPADPMPSNEPRLWPNVAASLLGGQARLFAGSGWTARDAWWALAGDPNVWAALPEADVLVLGVGSMDTLPSPLPSYLRAGIRYLRPDRLRRWSRTRYQAAQPQLSRLLATIGGRPVALPPRLSVRYLDDTLGAIRALRPTLPAVAILPATHIAASYGQVHPGHDPAVSAIRTWGNRRNVPLLDLTALTGEHVRSGRGNPDGMHWGWDGHEAVGKALAETVLRLTNTELPGVVPTT